MLDTPPCSLKYVQSSSIASWDRVDVLFGPATRLTIRVKQPETEHTVSVGKLHS